MILQAGENLILRVARISDAYPLWIWRNDEVTRTMSRNTTPVEWLDHLRWLNDKLYTDYIYIGMHGLRPVGVVRFTWWEEEQAHEISITTAPESRGQRVASEMLKQALEIGPSESKVYAAEIREQNILSQKLFEKHGFVVVEQNDNILRYWLP